jgi:protein-tyrosine phosphatase
VQETLDWLDKALLEAPVYVHCALGHGRTGTIVIAYLLTRGLEKDVDCALNRLRRSRPGLDINRAQRQFLKTLSVRSELP